MRNQFEALKAIEKLTNDDFASDMDRLISEQKRNSKLKEATKRIIKIYQIAHAEISTCRHPDWEEIKYEINK